MGVTRGRLLANLLGSVAILATIGVISFGLPAVDRSLSANRAVAHGQPYSVGAGVTVVPPVAAMVDVTRTRPGPDRGTALFVLDTIRYRLAVGPFTGTLDEAAARLRDKITAKPGYHVTGDERPRATAQGISGRQGGYVAPGRAGRYAVFVAGGRTIEVTISGTDPELDNVLSDIEASISSIEYRERP